MLAYFQEYYIDRDYGVAYIFTTALFVMLVVLLLAPPERTKRGIVRFLGEVAALWAFTIVYGCVYERLFGITLLSQTMLTAACLLFAAFGSQYQPKSRIALSSVFLCCYFQGITLSEPLGRGLSSIFTGMSQWLENGVAILVTSVLSVAVLAFLKRFPTDAQHFVPVLPVVLVVAISALGSALQWLSSNLNLDRTYSVLIAGTFWLLALLAYYMYYTVIREYAQRLEWQAMEQKAEMDSHMLEYAHSTYEQMHELRHEMKNHLAYLRVLTENRQYDKLRDYIDQISGQTKEIFRFIECGNDVINAVMNYASAKAAAQGIRLQHQIVVPKTLPYQESDLCSLFFNLLDNAIEAAAQSGAEEPVISVSIRPAQDYLFVRVTNPVDPSIPEKRRLSLRTTKQHEEAHGYGTKIIRKIVEAQHGSAKFSMEDGRFVADVMLYLGEAEAKAAGGVGA